MRIILPGVELEEARVTRGRTSSEPELLHEPLEERDLRGLDLLEREREREEARAVHLGEALAAARARRPLHLEGVAADRTRVVPLGGHAEGVHDLPALLADAAEVDEVAARIHPDPRLLLHLADRRRERV